MLNRQIIDLAYPMISAEMDERRAQIQIDIGKTVSDFSRRGIGTSSIGAIERLCGREIEFRASIIWRILHRIITTLNMRSTEVNGPDIKQEVRKNLPVNDLKQSLGQLATNLRANLMEDSLGPACIHAFKKVDAEIDLFIASLQQGEQVGVGSSSSTITFYSPVGVVQTGTGATAMVFQNATPEDRVALLGVLRQAKECLSEVERVPGYSKEEIIDLVDEGRTEIEKPKPNGLRLKLVFLTIGEAIRSVNTLHQVYQSLKTLLIPYGILLP